MKLSSLPLSQFSHTTEIPNWVFAIMDLGFDVNSPRVVSTLLYSMITGEPKIYKGDQLEGISEPLIHCIHCVRPHIYVYCDQSKERQYYDCKEHLQKCVNLHHSHQSSFLTRCRRPDPRITPHSEDIARQVIGEAGLALQREISRVRLSRGSPQSHPTRARDTRHYQTFIAFVKTPGARKRALNDMLKPTKVHREGCTHSDNPEMIICQDEGRDGLTSKLATALYFKRCEGTFKNLVGEKLDLAGAEQL